MKNRSLKFHSHSKGNQFEPERCEEHRAKRGISWILLEGNPSFNSDISTKGLDPGEVGDRL